jgi:hypothetical protein
VTLNACGGSRQSFDRKIIAFTEYTIVSLSIGAGSDPVFVDGESVCLIGAGVERMARIAMVNISGSSLNDPFMLHSCGSHYQLSLAEASTFFN